MGLFICAHLAPRSVRGSSSVLVGRLQKCRHIYTKLATCFGLTQPILGQVPEEAPSDLLCEECERRFAVGHCMDCDETLCAVCLAVLHIPNACGQAHMHLAQVRADTPSLVHTHQHTYFENARCACKIRLFARELTSLFTDDMASLTGRRIMYD